MEEAAVLENSNGDISATLVDIRRDLLKRER